ncbi:MAG TPA: PIN domain-containing protein [Candidatus Sulfotelmatobacter sp.]|nr:PIN domain-containing protein [Candidatus Sulfotelmatobacter sp.]
MRKADPAGGGAEPARVHLARWGGGAASAGRFAVDIIFVRLLFVVVVAVTCYLISPFGLSPIRDAGVGALIGAAIVLFEWKLRTVSLKRLIGAAIGSLLGICGAYLFALVIRSSVPPGNTQSFLQIMVMLLMAYVGLIVGANKGDLLNLSALGGIFGGEKQGKKSYKILDTSVIIDGRIADIAETGFLDGVIVTPQFVLRELQLVADSSDSLKRNRGRRGLDILQRLQKVANLQIQIVEDDFPAIREVDLKLIELAKLYEGKIITNDFNLNKVAQLQGVEVLNINELANSLKPIVLPGETMRVFILKEGKEYNQGVAYLDDGTMVVVDNARKMIGKTIDVSVTSVLQTTAGKMIFGKWDERAAYSRQAVPVPAPPVPVAVAGTGTSGPPGTETKPSP